MMSHNVYGAEQRFELSFLFLLPPAFSISGDQTGEMCSCWLKGTLQHMQEGRSVTEKGGCTEY